MASPELDFRGLSKLLGQTKERSSKLKCLLESTNFFLLKLVTYFIAVLVLPFQALPKSPIIGQENEMLLDEEMKSRGKKKKKSCFIRKVG